MELNWKEYEGKKVYVILKNNYEYNGVIKTVDTSSKNLTFIELIDKFGMPKVFCVEEIKFIEEKK